MKHMVLVLALLLVACGDSNVSNNLVDPNNSNNSNNANNSSDLGHDQGQDSGTPDMENDAGRDSGTPDMGSDTGNEGPDGLLPVLSNFRVEASNPDRLHFDSSEPISATDATGFVVGGRTISGLTVAEEVTGHYFTLDAPLTFWDNTIIRYEGAGNVQDSEGNGVAPFTLTRVQNQIPEPAAATDRFVSADASGQGDGTSENDAWTIQQAFTMAQPGHQVWIKAGTYANARVTLANNGTTDSPIKFVGYKSTPGDISTVYYNYGDGALDPAEMPLLAGSNRTTGEAIDIAGQQYLVLRNIQFQNYRYGVQLWGTASGNSILLDRLVGRGFGGLQTSVTGYGIYGTSVANHSIRIQDSVFMNASQTNVTMNGNHHMLDRVRTYSDENSTDAVRAASDYHLGLSGSHNIVVDSHFEHVGDLEHSGHGIAVKDSADIPVEYNLIDSTSVVNVNGALEFRHAAVRYNVAKNVTLDARGAGTHAAGLVFRDGASFNVFEDGEIRGAKDDFYGLIFFTDTVEDGGYGQVIEGNIVRNTVLRDGTPGVAAINFGNANQADRSFTIRNHTFVHCTFHNIDQMYNAGSQVTVEGTRLLNSIVSEVDAKGSTVSGLTESSTNYFGGYMPENGNGNISVDPEWLDATGELTPTNEMLNTGMATDGIVYDKLGAERMIPATLGAIETPRD